MNWKIYKKKKINRIYLILSRQLIEENFTKLRNDFFILCQFATRLEAVWRERGRKISVSLSQSSGPGFESRSDLDLFPGSHEFKSSAMVVNRELVCLRPIGN